MLDSLTQYVGSLSPGWLYVFLFAAAYLENVFPPVPGDTVTVFAAYLIGRTQRSFVAAFACTTLGSLAGFMTYYALGRLIPPEYFLRRNFRFLPASGFNVATGWFRKYGYWVVLLNRFFSGARGVISIVCGMSRLPWLPVAVLAGTGCAVWNGILIYAGYAAGANWAAVDRMLREYTRIFFLTALAAAGIWLCVRRLRSSRVGGK
jgi:membrane protein DedA with SNARE-associated domain